MSKEPCGTWGREGARGKRNARRLTQPRSPIFVSVLVISVSVNSTKLHASHVLAAAQSARTDGKRRNREGR